MDLAGRIGLVVWPLAYASACMAGEFYAGVPLGILGAIAGTIGLVGYILRRRKAKREE